MQVNPVEKRLRYLRLTRLPYPFSGPGNPLCLPFL